MIVPLEIKLSKTSKISFDLIKKTIIYGFDYKNIWYEKVILNSNIVLKFIQNKGFPIYIESDILDTIKKNIYVYSKDDMFICYKKCFLLEQLIYLDIEIKEHPFINDFYYTQKNKMVEKYIEKIKNLKICKSIYNLEQIKYFLNLKTIGLTDKLNNDIFKNNIKSLNNVYYLCNELDNENIKLIESGKMPRFVYDNKFKFLLGLEEFNKEYNLPIFTHSYIRKILKHNYIQCPSKHIFNEIINNIPNVNINKETFYSDNDSSLFYLNLIDNNVKCLKLNKVVYYTGSKRTINIDYDYIHHINNIEINTKSNINKLSNKSYKNYSPDEIVKLITEEGEAFDRNDIIDGLNPITNKPITLDSFYNIDINNFKFNFDRSKLDIHNEINVSNMILNDYNITYKDKILHTIKIKKNLVKKYKNCIIFLFNKGYFLNELGLTYYIDTGIILDNTIQLPEIVKIYNDENLVYFVDKNLK